MKIRMIILSVLFYSIIVLGQNLIKTKVGIFTTNKGKQVTLKSNDKLKVGDMFRIYLKCFSPQYNYIIYVDNKSAKLLNFSQFNKMNSEDKTLILPSVEEAYKVDATNPSIKIFVISSKKSFDEIKNKFEQSKIDLDSWKDFEQELIKKQKNLTNSSDKPFSIAGNVRGVEEIFNQLPLLTNRELIIRTYEIEVKK